jgi:hypothetical protein
MFTFTPGITMTAGITFSPNTTPPPTLDYLLVAGGGGGGGGDFAGNNPGGAGGGAGGYRTATGFSIASGTTYAVTVGTGGAGGALNGAGASGLNSVVSSSNSYSFNGSSQYLNVASNAAFNFGTGDFTIEMWIYITAGSTYQFLAGNDVNASSYLMLGINVPVSGTQTIAVGRAGVDWPLQFGSAITFASNTWYHVAVTRSGSTNKAFINGVQLGANITDSTNWSMSNPRIGSQTGGTNFGGNISNVRLVKGVSVYTGAFTVPTSPLTATQSAGTNISAITGVQTSLLTLQNATIIDNSSYGFAITNNGSVAFSSSTPFIVTAAGGGGGGSYNVSSGNGVAGGSGGGGTSGLGTGAAGNTPSTSPSQGNAGGNGGGNTGGGGGGGGGASTAGSNAVVNVGSAGGAGSASTIIPNYSISFNGTSQYLSVPNTAAQFVSSNWTVEGWIYLNSIGSVYHIIACYGYSSTTTRSWQIYVDLSGTLRLAQSTTGSDNFDAGFGTPTFAANTWYHVAVVRNGATITAYQNGVALSSTQTAQTLFTSSAAFTIGVDSTNYLAGYISNLRIVKGTAVYTSNFPVPTPPLRAITNTSLLTAQSSTIVDNSTNAFTITAIGSPTVSSSVIPTAYYAGGGGGGGGGVSAGFGVGGVGGGGRGSSTTTGTAGATNTGGGGGGAAVNNIGGAGGSGIAVIRYSDGYALATTTGSPSLTITGGYNIYTWTSSGSFIFTFVTPTVDYLVVAGGGGGGYDGGGGGGAGGLRTATGFSVTAGTPITVTVGSGGAGSSASGGGSNGGQGTSGLNSVFGSITANGGGGGGGDNAATPTLRNGLAGGSGGGGGGGGTAGLGNTPATTPSQGNNGGINEGVGSYGRGGGGGGAGAVGGNGSSGSGAGGAGVSSSISGSAVTYGGGGGGGGDTRGNTGGAGGAGGGGGGGGSNISPAVAGTVNTGGGGGGGCYNNAYAAAGGSGIVIIRYASTYPLAASTTGSPTVAIAGGYNIYTWTSSGSITF